MFVNGYESGSSPCDDAVYKKVAGILTTAKVPIFIVPDDNEWNDCADPAQAWTLWGKYFMRFEHRWQRDLHAFEFYVWSRIFILQP